MKERSVYFCESGIGRVPLSAGKWATVDGVDVPIVGRHLWASHNAGYAYTWIARKCVLLHRLLCPTDKPHIDHVNGDKLNCRRDNLRPATESRNGLNRTALNKNNSSGVRGVCFDRSRNLWTVGLKVNRKRRFIGRFASLEVAKQAYSAALKAVID